jgi:hypothetical protein
MVRIENIFYVESRKSIRPKFRSLDFSRTMAQAAPISKIYKSKNIEVRVDPKKTGKNRPNKHTSQLKLPTEVKDNKILDLKAGKITIGNQPNQRKYH